MLTPESAHNRRQLGARRTGGRTVDLLPDTRAEPDAVATPVTNGQCSTRGRPRRSTARDNVHARHELRDRSGSTPAIGSGLASRRDRRHCGSRRGRPGEIAAHGRLRPGLRAVARRRRPRPTSRVARWRSRSPTGRCVFRSTTSARRLAGYEEATGVAAKVFSDIDHLTAHVKSRPDAFVTFDEGTILPRRERLAAQGHPRLHAAEALSLVR